MSTLVKVIIKIKIKMKIIKIIKVKRTIIISIKFIYKIMIILIIKDINILKIIMSPGLKNANLVIHRALLKLQKDGDVDHTIAEIHRAIQVQYILCTGYIHRSYHRRDT